MEHNKYLFKVTNTDTGSNESVDVYRLNGGELNQYGTGVIGQVPDENRDASGDKTIENGHRDVFWDHGEEDLYEEIVEMEYETLK